MIKKRSKQTQKKRSKIKNSIDSLVQSLKKKKKKSTPKSRKDEKFEFIYSQLNEVDTNPVLVSSLYGTTTPTPTTCGGCPTAGGCTAIMTFCD